MKKIIILIFIVAHGMGAKAQIPSSCNVPQSLQNYYDRDIKHLALERIFNQNSTYKDSIIVPQTYQDTIQQGLAAIFNLVSVPERDSVFDIYCIHQISSPYSFNYIYVAVDTSYAWTKQWQNMITTTGITALDNLLSAYGFTIWSYSSFLNYATLTTPQNINVKPLCDSIETFAGVKYSEPAPYFGDGNKITYFIAGANRYYNFTLGYGDCPSGCIGYYTYKFKVYDDCSVDYLGVNTNNYTNEQPYPLYCNITTGHNSKMEISNDISLFPNPATTHLTLETPQQSTIQILTLQGQLIKTINATQPTTTLDISSLARGMYFIKAINENGIAVRKFIKE